MEALNNWLATYGAVIQIVGYIIQVIFYIAVGISAVLAALQFKRLVDFNTGGAAPAEKKPVPVDEFVD
jgi:hypothetical protein